MKPKRLAIIIGLLLFLMGNDAAAEPLPSPHVRLTEPGELTTNGKTYIVPRFSHILDEDTYLTVEREMKRLQEQETRLRAENQVLSDNSGISWGTVVVVGLSALALGFTVSLVAN